MRSLLLFLLIIANLLHAFALEKRKCVLTPEVFVHIANQLSSGPLTIHCQSKDDDLGIHTLAINQEFSWGFCDNAVLSTLFYCDISAGSKSKHFNAYTSMSSDSCRNNQCYWFVKDDAVLHGLESPLPFPSDVEELLIQERH
ncbi:S-protein5 [Sesamum angolense]|uniref:S-protein homolog n=1 Tax=Sesamum angolense TaxID=2727404 RepID=A0AAE2C084_9LAMI|nr:S-protein5 [Sesamum angolense]